LSGRQIGQRRPIERLRFVPGSTPFGFGAEEQVSEISDGRDVRRGGFPESGDCAGAAVLQRVRSIRMRARLRYSSASAFLSPSSSSAATV
jgi:hypothetical protein